MLRVGKCKVSKDIGGFGCELKSTEFGSGCDLSTFVRTEENVIAS